MTITSETLLPDPEGRPNNYIGATTGHLYALRAGQTAEQFFAESAAPPPVVRRMIDKSVVIARLIDAGKIAAAKAALESDAGAYARWWAPDRPSIYADDAEAIALIKAIGADPAVILA